MVGISLFHMRADPTLATLVIAPLDAPAVNIRQSTGVFPRFCSARSHPSVTASKPNCVAVAPTKPAPAPANPAVVPVIAPCRNGLKPGPNRRVSAWPSFSPSGPAAAPPAAELTAVTTTCSTLMFLRWPCSTW
ncbi:hypothetical protein NG2371_05294 [Nocardia gamkensis]|nr:hypothetical protein [Nocardia gamkensis]